MRRFILPISRPRDFTKSYDKTSYRILKQGPGPCLTTAILRYRKNSSQWQRSFQWKLHSHWLKFLRQRHVAVVRQGPGFCVYSERFTQEATDALLRLCKVLQRHDYNHRRNTKHILDELDRFSFCETTASSACQFPVCEFYVPWNNDHSSKWMLTNITPPITTPSAAE